MKKLFKRLSALAIAVAVSFAFTVNILACSASNPVVPHNVNKPTGKVVLREVYGQYHSYVYSIIDGRNNYAYDCWKSTLATDREYACACGTVKSYVTDSGYTYSHTIYHPLSL